jgi:hypothetical protein
MTRDYPGKSDWIRQTGLCPPVEDGLFIGLLDGLLLAGLLALDQLGLVQLRVHAQRLQLVPANVRSHLTRTGWYIFYFWR